ncbi:MAG: HAMP domain-containing protein [Spirochaetes bacterium]|nr:HAMP domain-containing protein [Spirochaetota bacterium]
MIRKKFQSLKIVLSSFGVGIVVVLTVVMVVISYNASYRSVENSYLNQLSNFNKDVETQLASFYRQQVNIAQFLATDDMLVNAAKTGNYGGARGFLANYYKSSGLLENAFISTAERNTVIVADAIGGKSVGLRWADNKVFEENMSNALSGKTHVGDPYKSPATGLPVVLITVPIMDGGRIVGIFGYSLDVGTFSSEIVKDIKIGKTGYPYICDQNGLAFAHPNKDMVFKLNVMDYDWGKEMLASESGTVLRYEFEGKDKIQTFVKNKEYRFISAATMYVSDINEDARSMAIIMGVFALIAIFVVGMMIFLFITRKLRPLDDCKNVMLEMAQGNLAKRYDGKVAGDEIGDIAQAMNNSLDQFEHLVSEIIVAVQNLSQAVQEIASGNENLSQRTSEQASSLEEVASTIEEATATIKQNADNSLDAKKMATESYQMAEEGGKIVGNAVNAINEVNVFSRKIGDIISVINEIAFQTNLLALNAAVEAARAGEQGRGFAVVAGEVRNLAQRAGSSAKEISQLIQDSLEKVSISTEFANKSGEALNKIISSVRAVDQLINEITTASEEQKRGIDQINIAVAELDTMTQQNAALVEETASASEEMSNQSQELIVMMEKFKIRDEVQSEVFSKKRKELHLHTVDTGRKKAARKDDGNGKKQIAPEALQAKNSTIKDILTQEGFEEF